MGERFVEWVRDRIGQLLRLLFGGSGAPAPAWIFYLIGVIGLAAVAFVVFRSTRGRFTEGLGAAQPAGPPAPAGYFAEAGRLAPGGDRVRALRNLCARLAPPAARQRKLGGG